MDPIIVSANRSKALKGNMNNEQGNFALLGNQDIKDMPFTALSIGSQALDLLAGPTVPIDKVLANNPAIRTAGSNLHNDFTYRGFRANGTSSLVNGIPGLMTQFNAPTYMMERIDMLNGPAGGLTGAAVQYESTAAGGLINFITKKAPDEDILSIKEVFSGKSNFGTYLDVSKRFGTKKEWGVRVNAESVNGNTSIDDEKVKAQSVYINIDHKSANSKTNLWMGYRDVEVKNGMRWFNLDKNVKTLPEAPKSSKNYSFKGMIKSSYGYVFALNHEQRINDTWTAFFNGGYNNNNLDQNIMARFSAYTLKNEAGDFNLDYMIGGTPQKSYFAQAGIVGNFNTNKIKHRVTFAVDKSWKDLDTAYGVIYPGVPINQTYGTLGTGNLYTGLNQRNMPISTYKTGSSAKNRMYGFSILDNMSYEKWGLLLGAHWHKSTVGSYRPATGDNLSQVSSSATSPTIALTYKPNNNYLVYANHSEYFDTGRVVAVTKANRGTILPPAKAKQNEVGIKFMKDDLLLSLSYFDISQATNIDVYRNENGINNVYTLQDGRDRYKGVDLSFNGRISDKWSVFGGAMYMNAKMEETSRGLMDGWLASKCST
ncbi:TonB-dependent receptor [Veillonella sp.]|uniref:TonB-dependent receptor n=1 Tax=Veillonella sp. TaxID=1926307 RepID=UPI0025D2207F|nr:TonB-dependent receptor [Veillonella sp.]